MPASLLTPRAPDPVRAHGAWVYLVVSILAGVLAATGRGVLPALCAGLAFVGVFLAAGALAIRPRPWAGRFAVGVTLTAAATLGGLALGADPQFLVYASVAVFPAGAAAWFALSQGYQSAPALAFAVVALVVSAPAAACAGGAHPRMGLVLLALLAPFFAWRTWRTRNALRESKGWDRSRLRQLGLREAAIAISWTAVALVAVHLLARGSAG
jgi:hypothetical protein